MRMAYLCFGVGFHNFATGRERSPLALVEGLKSSSPAGIEVLASYGATGNIALEADDRIPPASLALYLQVETQRQWAIVPVPEANEAAAAVTKWQPPNPEPNVRWTPGLSFCVERGAGPHDPFKTCRGDFRPLGRTIVAIYKRDFLTDAGTLDSSRRQGGWGAISQDISRTQGGTWTSRSLTPIQRLLDRTRAAL